MWDNFSKCYVVENVLVLSVGKYEIEVKCKWMCGKFIVIRNLYYLFINDV